MLVPVVRHIMVQAVLLTMARAALAIADRAETHMMVPVAHATVALVVRPIMVPVGPLMMVQVVQRIQGPADLAIAGLAGLVIQGQAEARGAQQFVGDVSALRRHRLGLREPS
jgi:hypothetical protein